MTTFFKRAYVICCSSQDCCQCPSSCGRPLLTHSSIRDFQIHTGKSGSVSCGVTAPFSWVLLCARFYLCPPRVCFPNPMEVQSSTPTGHQSQISWEYSVALQFPKVEMSVVGPRTFATVRELLWYNCSPVLWGICLAAL